MCSSNYYNYLPLPSLFSPAHNLYFWNIKTRECFTCFEHSDTLILLYDQFQVISKHCICVRRLGCKLHCAVVGLKLVLKLKIITLSIRVILVFNIFTSLPPNSGLRPHDPDIRFHPLFIKRIEFTKLIDAKFEFASFFISD